MAKNKTNSLLLKIPIYISEIQPTQTKTIFDLTLDDIIENLKLKIETYHKSNSACIFGKKGKSEAISIASIDAENIKFNEDPALLLRVSTQRTNLCGGTIHHKDEELANTTLTYSDTLTIPTNIIVLYPRIVPSKTNPNTAEWFVYVFVYEDPSKLNVDMSQLARQLMRNIFDTPIRNIKEKKFREEISALGLLRLEIVLSNFTDADDDDIPTNLRKYSFEVKGRKEKFISVENISADDAESLLNANEFNSFTQKIFRFFKDKRKLTAKFTERTKDAKVLIERTFEDCFNFEIEVKEPDLISGKIFETSTIKENIECLLKQL
ncbi:MAG: hypothetical protein JNG52_10280 [Muribaculaceae bacterium]|nr:hypothetical protein [Muribaculaceae bacterium]